MHDLRMELATEHIHDLQRKAAAPAAPRRRSTRGARRLFRRLAERGRPVGETGRLGGYTHLYGGVPGGWSGRCA